MKHRWTVIREELGEHALRGASLKPLECGDQGAFVARPTLCECDERREGEVVLDFRGDIGRCEELAVWLLRVSGRAFECGDRDLEPLDPCEHEPIQIGRETCVELVQASHIE